MLRFIPIRNWWAICTPINTRIEYIVHKTTNRIYSTYNVYTIFKSYDGVSYPFDDAMAVRSEPDGHVEKLCATRRVNVVLGHRFPPFPSRGGKKRERRESTKVRKSWQATSKAASRLILVEEPFETAFLGYWLASSLKCEKRTEVVRSNRTQERERGCVIFDWKRRQRGELD